MCYLTVRHVSRMVRIDEDVDVNGVGSTTAVGSINSSTVGSPERGPLDASPVEDSTLGLFELVFNWVALCLNKVAPIGAMICKG